MTAPRFASLLVLLPALLLTVAGPVTATALAQPPATEAADKANVGDPRVKTVLDSLKYKYTVTASKVYELTFDLKEKRSQMIHINTTTQKFSKLEIREVTSIAYKVKGKLAPDQALRLLADNDNRKWGGWRLVENEGFTYVLYAVQLPADSNAETLDNAIDAVMYTADDMEKEITKADEF